VAILDAVCPAGDVAVSGGWQSDIAGFDGDAPPTIAASGRPATSTWEVMIQNPPKSITTIKVQSYAYCAPAS
jgi:hypothetical protein